MAGGLEGVRLTSVLREVGNRPHPTDLMPAFRARMAERFAQAVGATTGAR